MYSTGISLLIVEQFNQANNSLMGNYAAGFIASYNVGGTVRSLF